MPKQISIPKEAKKKEIKRKNKESHHDLANMWMSYYIFEFLESTSISLNNDHTGVNL